VEQIVGGTNHHLSWFATILNIRAATK